MNFTESALRRLKPDHLKMFLPNNGTAIYPINVHLLAKQGLSSEMYSFQVTYDTTSKKKEKYILKAYKKGFENRGPKEFELLSTLNKHNILVPKVYFFNPNNEPEEKPFMIMESIKGKATTEFLRDEKNAPIIVDKLAEVLSRIHKLEPNIIRGSSILQSHYELQQRQLMKLRFFIQKSKGFLCFCSPRQKKFVSSLKRSENLKPKKYRPVILHGEYIPGHVLVSNGKFTVVDWGDALVGDPAFDVAWTYHDLNLGFETSKVNLGELFVQCYEKHAGQKLNNLEFCKDMVALKLAWEYRLSPFLKFTLFGYYTKIVDLTFGNILGKLPQALYMRRLKNDMQNHHTNGLRSVEKYQKYVVQYFEGIEHRRVCAGT